MAFDQVKAENDKKTINDHQTITQFN